MNAICGTFNRDEQSDHHPLLNQLMENLAYAGHDGQETWRNREAALGVQLTQIASESIVSNSLIYDPQWQLGIVADARLDNREQLSDLLQIPNEQRATISDSRLILAAYRTWHTDCLPYLLGDFAFAIWDDDRRSLFCGRDPFGVRPFYYHASAQRFLFATDMMAIRQIPAVPQDIDLSTLARQINVSPNTQQVTDAKATSFAAIRRLPPATALLVTADNLQTWTWWMPESAVDVRYAKIENYAGALRELLQQAIADRLRADYPIAGHLSGGLDSSSVALLAARQLRQRGEVLPMFYWGPDAAPGVQIQDDERRFVQGIHKQEELPLHYISPPMIDVARWRVRPFGDPPGGSSYREFETRRIAAAGGARVILSGLGGNRGISYDAQRDWKPYLLGRQQWWVQWHEAKSIARQSNKWVVPAYVRHVRATRRQNRRIAQGNWDRTTQLTCLQPGFFQMLPEPALSEPGLVMTVREAQNRIFTRGYLSHNLEGWAAGGLKDRIEYRYPLLDRRIVEFALGLPPEMYCQRGRTRYLFRYALQSVFPGDMNWQVGSKEPGVNQNRMATNQAFAENVVWPLMEALLGQQHDWQYLDLDTTRQVMVQPGRKQWTKPLKALRIEMLFNTAIKRQADSWLDELEAKQDK